MIIDASKIKAGSSNLRNADPWQMECMKYCTTAVDLFSAAARVEAISEDSAALSSLTTMKALGIRVLNSIGAADELIVQGFYQPAAIMIRDMVETSFLLDLFSRKPEHLRKWIALGVRAGLDGYRPKTVRTLLNEMDGVDGDVRQNIYSFYSQHGTHPNPDALDLIAPNAVMQIGPFVDKTRLIGLTYDMTRFAVLAAQHLCQWIVTVDLKEDEYLAPLNTACEDISAAFMTLSKHLDNVPIGLPKPEPEADGQEARLEFLASH